MIDIHTNLIQKSNMLFQIGLLQELQFLAYQIPVMIGLQVAFYFFYQYYKIKDVNLKLNRILLSYGFFILFMIFGAGCINVARLLIIDLDLKDFISKIGWASALLSPVGFLLFINLDEFSTILNLKIMKILMVLSFIPVIIVFFIPSTQSPIFLSSITFTVLNAYYIFSFQIKLIKRSVGNMKKRFTHFFIGELICLTSLFFAILVGLNVLSPDLTVIVFFIGVAILLSGFIILAFSAYEFPPFYEFEWKENLLKLFIIYQKNNACLYYHNFLEEMEENMGVNGQIKRDRLLPQGILGIETIISTITDTRDEKINKIKQQDSYILLEYGENPSNIMYVLHIKKDLKSLRHFIIFIKNQFESFFKEILINLEKFKGSEEHFFGSFDIIVKNIIET